MLRIICILMLFAGCWLPPHIPQPIPHSEGVPAVPAAVDETRNVCMEVTPDAPEMRVESPAFELYE